MYDNIKLMNAYESLNPEILLDMLGIQSELKSDELFFLCPNPDHADSNPSCSLNINPTSTFFLKYSCFGCQTSGSLIDLIKLVKECSFNEARKLIIQTAEEGGEWMMPEWANVRKDIEEVKIELPKEFVKFTNEDNYYTDYLINRGLNYNDLTEQGWGYCATGLCKKRVVLPIYVDGKLVNYYARHISTKNKANKVWNATGSKMDKVVWDYHSIDFEKDYIWITESVFNRVSLLKASADNVICLFGDKLSDKKFEMLDKFKEIRVVPDGDRASKKLVETIFNYYGKEKTVKIVEIPKGEDANSVTLNDLKELLKALKKVRSNDFRSHLIEIDYSIPKKNN